MDPTVTLDSSLMALSGRIKVRESCTRSADEIVTELWERHLAPVDPDDGPPHSPQQPQDPNAPKR
jgi:hypothetical protein